MYLHSPELASKLEKQDDSVEDCVLCYVYRPFQLLLSSSGTEVIRSAFWSAENEALPQSKALWSAESEAKKP